jgi:hypothetical protein
VACPRPACTSSHPDVERHSRVHLLSPSNASTASSSSPLLWLTITQYANRDCMGLPPFHIRDRLYLHQPYPHALDHSLTHTEEDQPTSPCPSVTSFALCLPIAIQVHSVFRVSQLEPESPNPSNDRELPLPLLIVDSILEYFRMPLTMSLETIIRRLSRMALHRTQPRTPCERLTLPPCRSSKTTALQTRLRQFISVIHSTTAPLHHHPCFRPVTSSPTQVSLNLCPRGLGCKKGDTVRNIVDL